MIEIRNLTEHWIVPTGCDLSVEGSDGPRLQYRTITNPLEIGLQKPIWSDWIDVEDVHINEGK